MFSANDRHVKPSEHAEKRTSPRAWKHIQAIGLLPGMVTVVIPAVIVRSMGMDGAAIYRAAPWNGLMLGIAAVLMGTGLSLFVATLRLFVRIGRGTLAPWNPTERLVAAGVYRYVRNPMISGVMCILLGEAVLFGSLPLVVWFVIFAAVNITYIPLVEEPGLEKRFGSDYVRYRTHVPRWLPRLTAWEAGE